MEDKAAAVEKMILNSYTEPGMLKVVEVHATPAVKVGENFLSNIWRLSITLLLENGEIRERNYILKNIPTEESQQVTAILSGAFTREIMMYEQFIKKMDAIMTDFGDTEDRPWCDLIYHKNNEAILMQDLKPLGYCPSNKLEGMTLDEAKLILRTLGRFHAASKAAEEAGRIDPSLLTPRGSTYNAKVIESWIARTFRFASQAIDKYWEPQWKDLAAKLNQPTEVIINKTIEAYRVDQSRFNTILHGDLWTNNILIQNDKPGAPKSVKFVDFQLSYYNSVVCDLMYLAYTSLRHDLRKQHWELLLKIYVASLQENLKRYNYPLEKMPTYEYILEEMKRTRFLAIVYILLYEAITLTGATGNTEDTKILLDPSIVPEDTPEIYRSKIFRDSVTEDLLELIENGALD